jgi:hypothetical protein
MSGAALASAARLIAHIIRKITRPNIVWPSSVRVEEFCKSHKSFIDVFPAGAPETKNGR